LSTQFAEKQQNIEKISVQHHHAHIVSCMAENKLDGPVVGLSFDGTGFGTDGAIWGGEVLIVEEHNFERAGHLRYVPMPGSTAAIKEPWRMAVSYLKDSFGKDFNNLNLPGLKEIESEKLTVVSEMITKGVNSPLTSSLGRLFDGVAAICGVRNQANFEGQAAMELEMLAVESDGLCYDYDWETADVLRILPAPIIRGVVTDILNKVPIGEISARFHQTLIHLFANLCEVIRSDRGLNRVVLSGGCFQNSILLSGMLRVLQSNQFEVFTHEQVPTNDGGIAMGQAVVAAAINRRS
jgi:hydrogenase maturation protein HypF